MKTSGYVFREYLVMAVSVATLSVVFFLYL